MSFKLRLFRYPAPFALIGALCMGVTTMERSMANPITPKPPSGSYVKAADHGADAKALDEELTKYLRGKYLVQSAHYYTFSDDVPWVAIAKNVQNQMQEKSIPKVVYEWNNPGYDLVDVYPQGDTAFAVAILSKTKSGKTKLVGYFSLTAKK